MKLFVALFLFILPITANASNCKVGCVDMPTCEDLGYSKTIRCGNGSDVVLCPFDSSYKWCKQYSCEDGKYRSSAPTGEEGWSCPEVSYNGLKCYNCSCKPSDDCIYNSQNQGSGTLSNRCCNGNYKKCITNCPGNKNYPKNSTPTYSACLDCGKTIMYISGFTCNEGYVKSDNGERCVNKPY